MVFPQPPAVCLADRWAMSQFYEAIFNLGCFRSNGWKWNKIRNARGKIFYMCEYPVGWKSKPWFKK